MSQVPEQKTVPPSVARSEELIDRMGQNIGSFAALTKQRIQQTAIRLGTGLIPSHTAQNGQPKEFGSNGHALQGSMPQAEMDKAEKIIDNMGQRLNYLSSTVDLQVRKMAAYAREGTEDILAEAQHLRNARRGALT